MASAFTNMANTVASAFNTGPEKRLQLHVVCPLLQRLLLPPLVWDVESYLAGKLNCKRDYLIKLTWLTGCISGVQLLATSS